MLILTCFKELAGIKAKTIMWYLAHAIFKSFTLSQLMVDRLSWKAERTISSCASEEAQYLEKELDAFSHLSL